MRTRLAILILVAFGIPQAWGQEQVKWLTGSQLDRQARETAISLDWQSAPLRQRLRDLSKSQRISVFLDRQIDGSQKINFSVINASFEQMLWRLCDQIDAGMCRVEDVYYIGPKNSVASLPGEITRLKNFVRDCENKALKRRWQRKAPMNLPRLSEPRSTLAELFQSNRCAPTGLETIPHDLWAEMQLGNLSLSARISLLLAGFDKTFALNENLTKLEIVARTMPEIVSREFRVGNQMNSALSMISKEFSDLTVTAQKRSIVVEGRVEHVLDFHRKLVAMQKPNVAELSDQTFDLAGNNQRIQFLNAMAAQVGRELSFDEAHRTILERRVEMNLKQSSVKQIIEKTLEGTDLTYRISEKTLEIRSK